MKRSICISLFAAGLAACSSPEWRESRATAAASEWAATPAIVSVARSAQVVRIGGVTEAEARVVLRAGDGAAYATGSDGDGRFSLNMPTPAVDTLFVVEGQRGEASVRAPYELLIGAAPSGPAALLADGAPTRRIDPSGPLDALDSDGRALAASGRAAPGAEVRLRIDGRPTIVVRAGPDGRWSAPLASSGAAPLTLTINERRYLYPGPGVATAPLLEPAGEGWRAVRRLGDASWQSSWLPRALP